MLSLNIIGAGRVGQTLGRLLSDHQQFQIAQVFNLTPQANQEALAFIGAGTSLSELALSLPADITLLSVPDDDFLVVTEQLIKARALVRGSILFHCSGSKSSQDLARLCPALHALEIQLASIHPVRSFADPSAVCRDFSGTICSVEGDPQALAVLLPAFEVIGARIVGIDPQQKLLYHAASVFASNYLVTLIDTAIATYCAAGVEPDIARQMAASLAGKTLENVFALGTQQALTGPIKRGDMQTVSTQSATVSAWNADRGALYQAFILPTIDLAKR
ncbi:Rossmann-like and DUF2520 domain-containing protein [Undibacterium flavidum]|uniref:DUF2520 domain-containing protein n=1 Tax=Undibacterium flavidum TaxID=2762297 RepID=A0ABR6YGT1_9BURK|nr:Rossmann-like and DUF2520 domain-containing protein [Undibacterium flavidum]MBC3875741.1 DUF2520 domain-containing protein [Undibacterium flavidum]